jgi:hypothetical protein
MGRTRSKTAALASTAPTASRQLPRLVISEASLSAAKWLALVLMIVDHSNKYLLGGSQHWMYALGRISMPLFAVTLGYNLARPGMLANGGYRRLAVRLAVFGLLATVPFIAINKLPAVWWPLNMMFTLLVAVVTAWLLDKGGAMPTIAAYLVLVWGGALGEYWWPAVGLCLCVWAYQRQPSRSLIFGFVVCLVLLYFVSWNLWALAAVPVLVLLQRWTVVLPRAQWLFYAIYPAHLALFWWYLSTKG